MGSFRFAITSLVFSIVSAIGIGPARAQLAPTGSHYAGRASDTGFSAVSGTGGYSTSVPLAFPAARGGLPLPVAITYGGRGVGAAGLGWDVPLSYVRHHQSVARRRPAYAPGSSVVGREQVVLSLGGQLIDMVKTKDSAGEVWMARQGAPDLELRNESSGLWVLRDGKGQEYRFRQTAYQTSLGDLYPLASISSPGNSNRVEFAYNVADHSFTGGSGVSIDLISVVYNTHPSSVGCKKDAIRLLYKNPLSEPISLSLVDGVAYVRMRTLQFVDVMRRDTCGATLQRIARYELSYAPDPDTSLPRLQSVRMAGRQGTQEVNVWQPVATYGYGSATGSAATGRVMRYQRGVDVAFPAEVSGNAQIGRTFHDPDATPPGYWELQGNDYVWVDSWKAYLTSQNLLDVTGDGRPDLVFQNGDQLFVSTNRPAGGSATTLTASAAVPLSDSTFSGGPMATYWNKVLRYELSFQNESNVWRQTIDVNGDGRLDVIDANEQPGYWTIYLNTPGNPVTWVQTSVRVSQLRDMLVAQGHVIGDYVPLARRTTGFDTRKTECWRWNQSSGRYEYQPGDACGSPDPVVAEEPVSGEMTFTEWEVRDINGDGYPDVVFNSSPVRREDFSLGFSDGDHGPVVQVVTRGLRPADGGQNSVLVAYNVAGVRLAGVDWLSSAVSLIPSAACGVGEWLQGGFFDDDQWVHCGFEDVNGDGIVDFIEHDQTVHLGSGTSDQIFISDITLQLPGRILASNPHKRICESGTPGGNYSAKQLAALRDLTGDGIPDFVDKANGVWIVTAARTPSLRDRGRSRGSRVHVGHRRDLEEASGELARERPDRRGVQRGATVVAEDAAMVVIAARA